MKATAGRPQSVDRAATAGRAQPVESGRVSLTSSLVLSLVLHGALVLCLLGAAWLLSRSQPYRLASQTVFLVGDSPVAIDQVLGEGGGVPVAKPESKEPGGGKSAQVETGAEPAVEKFAPPVEKPVPPPPKPAVEKAAPPPPPKPVVEKTVPPPPKPVVEKAAHQAPRDGRRVPLFCHHRILRSIHRSACFSGRVCTCVRPCMDGGRGEER